MSKIPEEEKKAFIGAAVATAAITAGTSIAVAVTQSKPINPSLWSDILQTNVPLNKMTIFQNHNAGSTPGSGTLFVAQNQQMSTLDILNQTPVRSVEFKVYNNNGSLIINHGGIVDPTVNPSTLQDQLKEISTWLNESGNSSQVLILQVSNGSNSLSGDDKEAALKQIYNMFGSKIYDIESLNQTIYKSNFEGLTPEWPTVSQLSSSGKNIVLVTEHLGSKGIPANWIYNDPYYNAASIGAIPASMQFNRTIDDRTLIGYTLPPDSGLGQKFTIDGQINTGNVNIATPGIISLSQIQPNDPRFFNAGQLSSMALDPDISMFGGVVQLNRGVGSSLMFAGGEALASATGSFAIANSFYQAYWNNRFIEETKLNIIKTIAQIEPADLEIYKKSQKLLYHSLTADDIKNYCKRKLSREILANTVKAGAIGTTSISGSILASGLLFPPALAVMAPMAIGIVGAGVVATTIAAFQNKRKLHKKFEQITHDNHATMEGLIRSKLKELQTYQANNRDITKDVNDKKKSNMLANISAAMLTATLFTRVTGMAKYAMPLIGQVAGSIVSTLLVVQVIADSVTNYRQVKKQAKDIKTQIKAAYSPNIDQKTFGLFGKTPLDRYISKHYPKLEKEELSQLKNDQKIRLSCREDLLEQNIRAYFLSNQIKYSNKQEKADPKELYDRNKKQITQDYLAETVGNNIASNISSAGWMGSIKAASGIAGWSILFPPASMIFLTMAAVTIAIGGVITSAAAHIQKRKFQILAKNEFAQQDKLQAQQNMHIAEVSEQQNKAISPQIINAIKNSYSPNNFKNSSSPINNHILPKRPGPGRD